MHTNRKYFQLTASEFDWNVSEGKTIKAWGFNERVPGPVIKAKRGDELFIKVKNNLNQPTLIHWHGVRLPAAMDGSGEMQKPIQPGEEFVYRFHATDAGTFWYHSHQDETVQLERGMYGALVIEDESGPVTDGDRVFMIDDMKLDKSNEFSKGGFIERWKERHDGREGETVLINGKEGLVIDLNSGQTERWRFVNSSSARYFLLNLGGKEFRIIGTDGGLIEKPVTVKEALITPGERLDILVGPFNEGDEFPIETLPYNRMTFLKSKRKTYAIVKVGEKKESNARISKTLRTIEPLANHESAITRKIKFSVGPSLKRGIDFLVNNELHGNDKPVNVGELQVWELSNTSLMDHPFHLHGFFFQVIEVNGKAPDYIAWKDTINLPPRSNTKIAWIPDNRPGMWMYHCHILEHHAAGMMANFEVVDPMKGKQFSEEHHMHHH